VFVMLLMNSTNLPGVSEPSSSSSFVVLGFALFGLVNIRTCMSVVVAAGGGLLSASTADL